MLPPLSTTLFPYTTLFRSPTAADADRSPRTAVPRTLPPGASFVVDEGGPWWKRTWRSEEHTSELQSHRDLVCRLLLEKKNRQLDDSRQPTLGRFSTEFSQH